MFASASRYYFQTSPRQSFVSGVCSEYLGEEVTMVEVRCAGTRLLLFFARVRADVCVCVFSPSTQRGETKNASLSLG